MKLFAPLLPITLVACAMSTEAPQDPEALAGSECGIGTFVEEDGRRWCVYPEAAPDLVCPDGTPHRLFAQNDFPGWAMICTDRAPLFDGTSTLPAEVCSTARAFDCLAVEAVDGEGVCCDYTGSCSAGGHGGWAPRTESCPGTWAYDGAFSEREDAWGCPYLEPRGLCSEMCCIVP